MNPISTFQKVMVDLEIGDKDAADVVFQRFTEKLIRLARSKLDARLQQKVDPEDVLQSVYRTFFRRQQNNEFDLKSWDELWALLVTITVRKCCKQARHYRREKRDIFREESPCIVDGGNNESSNNPEWKLISREPTPQQAILLTELLEQMMCPFDEQGQTIISMKLQGYDENEISSEIDRTVRTVRRVLSRVRTQLVSEME